ncbi:MAG: LysM peptidoglycan-binding domain-containing protein [Clostridiales bacterium]|nr:LysM peptidoglycan-binding domain-containing protein [Clostridiales bacterium]
MSDNFDKTSKIGDTLDYYNDEMSRKAVGKLFNERAADKGRASAEKSDKKRTVGRSVPQDDKDDSEDNVKNLDKLYNFSLYRKKSNKEKSWEVFAEDNEDAKKSKTSKVVKKRFTENPVETTLKDSRNYKERGTNRTEAFSDFPGGREPAETFKDSEKSKIDASDAHATGPETPKAPALTRTIVPARMTAPSARARLNHDETSAREGDVLKTPRFLKTIYDSNGFRRKDEVDFLDDSEKTDVTPAFIKKSAAVVCAVTAVAIIVALAVRVASVGAELSAARVKITELNVLEEKNSQLTMENESLYAQVSSLTDQLGNPAFENESETRPVTAGSESVLSESLGTKLYVVQPGDTLSAISRKYYGVTTEVKKIQDANNMTSPDLQIGDEIIIP